MSKIILEITMSLDGFVAGPSISAEHPLGKGGERLHDWLFSAKTEVDEAVLATIHKNMGAVVVGGNTYVTAIDDAWGGKTPFEIPAFVATNKPINEQKDGFTYVTDGLEETIKRAVKAANGKDVWVMGGGGTIAACIEGGWYDEFYLHVAPVLLKNGLKLFDHLNDRQVDFKNLGVSQSPQATHMVLGKI
ncbi:MAG TPA: dihydrofolate reductase family protein [Candidatus Saccharimonadales bacterium]|nr:dihydrofolate reductase family protein [Candidatus Saccharimonadales bacterium]